MMFVIVGECRTFVVMLSSSTTNGKNERMTFAATENANVCTSVEMRYRAVGRMPAPLRSASGAVAVATAAPLAASEVFAGGMMRHRIPQTSGARKRVDDNPESRN